MEDDYMNNKFDSFRIFKDKLGYDKYEKYDTLIGGSSMSGKSSFYSDYKLFVSKARGKYYYDVEMDTSESEQEKAARLLREKAEKRNDKIDKLLRDGGL